MSIKIENLSFGYIKRPLSLIDVSCEVNDGKVIALLGGDGAGKTSFFNVLSGLQKQYLGKIIYDNKLFDGIENKTNISYLLSEPAFFENKSILFNFEYQLQVAGIKMNESDIAKVCDYFDFKIPLSIKIKKLKNVDKKILSIIRSYLKKPKYVFIDDMFSRLNDSEINMLKNAILTYLNDKKWVKTVILAEKTDIINFDFNKIFYLNYGRINIFDDLKTLKNNLVDLHALNYFEHTRKDYYLAFDGENYFLISYKDVYDKKNKNAKYEEEKRLLIDNCLYDKLSKCVLKQDQEMEVTLTSLDMLNINDLFFDLNKYLLSGQINMFEKNTFVKIL